MKFQAFTNMFVQKRRLLVLSRELSSASFYTDEYRLPKILSVFGNKHLSHITPLMCERFFDSLILAGFAPSTRNRYRALLYSCLKYAVRLGYLSKNPVVDIPILSERLKKRKVDYWKTEVERDRYIEAAFQYGSVFGIAAALLGLGGCRISEALAIEFQDIEWDSGYVQIRKILERHTNTVQYRTKGQRAGGEYGMLLVPRLQRILKEFRQTSLYNRDDDFVLSKESKVPLSYSDYYGAHRRIIEKAKVKYITPHDIRRTFATFAEKAGFHKAEIGEMLGHETLVATEAYTKMDVSHLVEKAKRIGFGLELTRPV